MIDVDNGTPSPEVYSERPILFRTEDTGAILYGMREYRAGRGESPAPGDELVLSVLGPQSYSFVDRQRVENPRQVYLEGVFVVSDVKDGDIDSPFFTKPAEGKSEFWGLKVRKVRDIETEDDVDRAEGAGLVSMI